MVCENLLSLPEEVLIYLCWFLLEEDVLALSDTCVYLKNSLNCDKVWKRFTTQNLNLEVQEQQVSPAFIPEPGLCEAKLNVLKKNHLLDNWRNGRCKVHESSQQDIEIYSMEDVTFYKEDCLLVFCADWKVEMWDIRTKPVLLLTKPTGRQCSLLVVQDYLVVFGNCIVDVYKIDIEDKSLTFIYSFSITANEVEHGKKPVLCCEHDEGCLFKMIKVKDLIVFSPEKPNTYRTYIWDIVNARRIGDFFFQSLFAYQNSYLCSHDNQVFLQYEQTDRDTSHYFQFDMVTHKFFPLYHTKRSSSCWTKALFYNEYCLTFTTIDSETLDCEVIQLPSAAKLKKRCFDNVFPWFLDDDSTIVVTSGKIVIPCLDAYYILSATNLDTEVIIPHNAASVQYVCLVNVCGSVFLLTVENKSEVKMWDLQRKTSVLVTQSKDPCFNSIHDFKICGREYSWPFKVLVEEDNLRQLHTKIVAFWEKKITVVHFW